MPELTFVALMGARKRLGNDYKGTLLGDGVRIDLCCGSHADFLKYRRNYWIARYKCALPKRPRRGIHWNMLPAGPVDMDVAAATPPPLPMGMAVGRLDQQRYGPGSPSIIAEHAAFHVDP
eukprot:5729151-Alexandrium_andersonii.AAC.1